MYDELGKIFKETQEMNKYSCVDKFKTIVDYHKF